MKKIILPILFFLAVSGIFMACEKDQGPMVLKPAPIDGDTIVSFSNDIQPIFDEFCVECHNQSHPFLDLRNFYSYNELWYTGNSAPYVDTLNPVQSYIIKRLQGNGYPKMPPNPPLPSDGKIDTIMIWIRQGAHNN